MVLMQVVLPRNHLVLKPLKGPWAQRKHTDEKQLRELQFLTKVFHVVPGATNYVVLNLWALITLGWLLVVLFLDPNPFIFPKFPVFPSVMGQPGGSPGIGSSMLVLMVVYLGCVASSLGHLVALKERGPRRRNMGVVTVNNNKVEKNS